MKRLMFVFVTCLLLSCSDTIEFNGNEFEHLVMVPMAFGKDTVVADIWYNTLNPDGEYQRVVKLKNGNNTSVFEISNAVNNSTSITFYSVKSGDKRLLWMEDNFGTTVYDIDLHRKEKVRRSEKELNEISPSGAPIGEKHPIGRKQMLWQLRKKLNHKFQIFDSLTLIL